MWASWKQMGVECWRSWASGAHIFQLIITLVQPPPFLSSLTPSNNIISPLSLSLSLYMAERRVHINDSSRSDPPNDGDDDSSPARYDDGFEPDGNLRLSFSNGSLSWASRSAERPRVTEIVRAIISMSLPSHFSWKFCRNKVWLFSYGFWFV